MDIIFDNLKQFVIKEVKEKIKLDKHDFFDLKKNTKYLVCYYNENNEPICCEYLGYFAHIDNDWDDPYQCDAYYGYYFTHNLNSNTSFGGVREYDLWDDEKDYSYHKFFELDNTFNFITMEDIYKFVASNTNPEISNELSFKYIYKFIGEHVTCEIYDKKYDEIFNL